MWKNRHKIIAGVKEIGCGLLTVLFITIPVWVMTLGWRGPVFAFGALAVLLLAVIGLGVLNRLISKD